jgi:predicted TIM-barrel fold metal-dependent hydrolase
VRDGLRILDADAHVIEPSFIWDRYLDSRFTGRIEWRQPVMGSAFRPVTVDGRYTQSVLALFGVMLRGRLKTLNWTKARLREKFGEVIDSEFRGDAVAEALRPEGIDLMIVYDGVDGDIQAGMARAYHRWGQEMRESSGGRVHCAGPVPVSDVARAVEEIQYAYEHLGTRMFWARPNPMNHRTLGDRYYDPIYEVIADLDCAFATHEFLGFDGFSAGSDRFQSFTEWHTVAHPHEAQMAVLAMIANGVFERHPRLRCAYLEAGCGWLPSWLDRIDEHIELTAGAETPELSMSALDYFKRNCWISTECSDRHVAHVVDELGPQHIVFESDYPHPESQYPNSVSTFLDLLPERLPRPVKGQILWDNAMELYRLPTSELPKVFHDVETGMDVAVSSMIAAENSSTKLVEP